MNTADSQYQEMSIKVKAMLARLQDALATHAKEQALAPLDYGFVGDAGLIESYLRDALAVLVGEDGI